MYDFAVLMLLGLAVVKVVELVEHLVPATRPLRTLSTMVFAVGGTVALDYSIFANYGIAIRNETVGIALTGVIVAGTVSIWRTLFSYLGSSEGDTASTSSKVSRIAA